MASSFKKFCKGGEFSGSYSRGQSLEGYPDRPIQSSLKASAWGPSQTSQPFYEFGGYLKTSSFSQRPMLDSKNGYGCGESGHIRKYCPTQSYKPAVIRGKGGHSRGLHSGGRGGQGNGGHQFSRGGRQVGTTAAYRGRGNEQIGDRAHCYAFYGMSEAETSDVVITGRPLVCDCMTSVLIDPGSTISYVYSSFDTGLYLYYDLLDMPIRVSTPVGEPVIVEKPRTDLLVCESDYISTPVRIISFLHAKTMVSKGCLTFLAHLRDDIFEVPLIESVLIVCDFLDVFPANLPGMTPDRDSNICIDLEPSTRPISIPPYRMDPAELRELKAQLQELFR
ncbi:uncharacterized protein [Solanum lycopersicum]|uniref:uncharacterized protein n=1 Tax=Solanum lycopersicum TaxID=4081 RepID=UPI0037494295